MLQKGAAYFDFSHWVADWFHGFGFTLYTTIVFRHFPVVFFECYERIIFAKESFFPKIICMSQRPYPAVIKPRNATPTQSARMQYLFDSTGQPIAIWMNDQLYTPAGRYIAHYMVSLNIFIDRQGYYLGEILYQNRLLNRIHHAYRHVCFGSPGDYGNIDSNRQPASLGGIRQVPGFRDVEHCRLLHV